LKVLWQELKIKVDKMTKSSKFSGFYKLSPEERLKFVAEFADLSQEDIDALTKPHSLGIEKADGMIENVIGVMELPVGVAVNFQINDRDYVIPMVLEEPSVVAAVSNMAKAARKCGGFRTSSTDPVMIAQIQLVNITNPEDAKKKILDSKAELLKYANEQDPILVKFGGGARDLEVRIIESEIGPMVITHLLVDCRDAMGANAVNTMAEALAPEIEKLTGGRVYLRILSNLAKYRLARAKVLITPEAIGGEDVVQGIIEAHQFAKADPFRCATHNKGIMNGIDAVIIATGNDFRAIEAGAHAYATLGGGYQPLTEWKKDDSDNLVGRIELPMAVGLIGGAVKTHPVARTNVKILGVKTANELGEIVAAVGLAQNMGALKALATTGIQHGHMRLHARNVAINAGAPPELMEKVVERMLKEKKIRADRAVELIKELQS
jgi:hydroxymethylglutaryl-CoA reductase